jgi:hypothetical protein
MAWQNSAIAGSLDESSRIVKPDLLNEVKAPSPEGVGNLPCRHPPQRRKRNGGLPKKTAVSFGVTENWDSPNC